MEYRPHPCVTMRSMPKSGAVLYHALLSRERFLNATGTAVWRNLSAGTPFSSTVEMVANEFDEVPDTLSSDLQAFMESLYQEEFVYLPDEPMASTLEAIACSSKPLPTSIPDYQAAPLSLDLSLTRTCNASCTYCFYHSDMVKRSDLPTEDWQNFFDELGRYQVRSVCLSGGEVFCRPDFWTLYDRLVANRVRVTILSNGSLINEACIRDFLSGYRARFLNQIQISCDGSCPQVHDSFRGHGSHALAVNALRLLGSAGLPRSVRVTVGRHNVDDLHLLIPFLLDELQLPRVGLNDAMALGSGSQNHATIQLSAPERLRAMQILSELDRQYPGRLIATAGALAQWRTFSAMEVAATLGVPTNARHRGYLSACGCVHSKLAVHHDGTYIPCNMLPEMTLGNIREVTLDAVWRSNPTLLAMRQRENTSLHVVDECRSCEWNHWCNAGCPALSWSIHGDLNHANPYDCYRRFRRELGHGLTND